MTTRTPSTTASVAPTPQTHTRIDPMSDTATRFAQTCDLTTHRRYRELLDRHRPLREAFVDLEELVVEYVHDVPFPDDRSHGTDAARFAGWLETTWGLTPEQHACLHAVSV